MLKFQDGAMLPIDHIPMSHQDLGLLSAAFVRLGFFVAPPAEFRSPDTPGEVWPSRGVFLERGWFDLQEASAAPADRPAVPGSCLFLASDLESATRALAPMKLDPPFRLTRHWADARPGPQLSMAFANLRARVAPFMLAVIAYDAPGSDVDAAWRRHPNTALEILGPGFPDPSPGPAAEDAARVLDLSGFRYGMGGLAVRIRVEDLDRVIGCLEAGQLEFTRGGLEIHVPPFGALGCAFVFSA
ncbi:MAG: hypothetical protein CFE28_03555 [Alphaproteobacteria bacterium PA2]|nr:MAG: hypothetical protein CFE28_03555 [Alphaproteobacteria bacterium PA2]